MRETADKTSVETFEILSASSRSSMRAALLLAVSFGLVELLLQFALTLWTTHLGYGYFRDEFYFLACGRHLAWGYVDQGPIVALQARLTTFLFGDSIFGIRVISAFAGSCTVALGGLLAWALGGGRSAQALAMLGLIIVPVYLAVDGFLSITSPEPVFWMGCILALVLMQRGAPAAACWLAVGVLGGVGLLNKPSMVFFLVALLFGLLLTPERRLLRTPWFAVATFLTLLIVSPFLLWQVHNGWPTWEFLQNAKAGKDRILGPLPFVWAQIAQMHPANALLWVTGLVTVLRGRLLPGFRWIGVTFLIFLATMFALHAKDYYLAPVYPMLFAAGAAAWEKRFSGARHVRNGSLIAFPLFESVLVITGLMVLPLASPVLRPAAWVRYTRVLHLAPTESETIRTSALPQFYADRFGWNQLASIVVGGYRSLPPAEREHVCIFANNYGEASSLELLGRRLEPHLPPVISPHNTYWLWGMRGCSSDPIIAVVGDTTEELKRKYISVTVLGQVTDPLAMPYERKHVYLLRGRKPEAPVNWKGEKIYI